MGVVYKYVGDEKEAQRLRHQAEHYLEKYRLIDNSGDHFNKTITLCSRKSINISRLGEDYIVTITVRPKEPEIEMIEEGGRLQVNATPSVWVGVRVLEPEAAKGAIDVVLQVYVPNAIELFNKHGANAGDVFPSSAVSLIKSLGSNYEHGYTKNTKHGIEGMTNYGHYFSSDEIDPFDGETWDVTYTASEDKYRDHMQALGLPFNQEDFYSIVGRYMFKVAAYDSEPCPEWRDYGDEQIKMEMRIVIGLPGYYRQSQRHIFTIEKPAPFKHHVVLDRVLGEDVDRDAEDSGCWMYYWDDVGENPHTSNWWSGAAFAHITSQRRGDPASTNVDFWSPKGSITFTDGTFIPDWGFNPDARIKTLDQFCKCDAKDRDQIRVSAGGFVVTTWSMTDEIIEVSPCTCVPYTGRADIRYGVNVPANATPAYPSPGENYVMAWAGAGPTWTGVPGQIKAKVDEGGGDIWVDQEFYCNVVPLSCVGGVPQFCGCDEYPLYCLADKVGDSGLFIKQTCNCPNGPDICGGCVGNTDGECAGKMVVGVISVEYKGESFGIFTNNIGLHNALQVRQDAEGAWYDIDRSPIGIPVIGSAQPIYGSTYYRAEDLTFLSYTEADGFQPMENPVK